jgi:hypothetical protein
MHLRLALDLFHFLPDLDELCALRHSLKFYEIHPWSWECTIPLKEFIVCKEAKI